MKSYYYPRFLRLIGPSSEYTTVREEGGRPLLSCVELVHPRSLKTSDGLAPTDAHTPSRALSPPASAPLRSRPRHLRAPLTEERLKPFSLSRRRMRRTGCALLKP
eukprot:3635214-Pyramimonas_sp.AAC.1